MGTLTSMIDWAVWLTEENLGRLLRVVVLLLVGLPLLYLATRLVTRFSQKHFSTHSSFLIGKAIFYAGSVVILLMVLSDLGFKLTAVLGAAGIAGVAIGFASQTSLSNIISGLFLVWEKPFAVGDAIKVGEHVGAVYSIDLMSVKLRTFDNRFVRIPNESIVKGQTINITRFPIRRLDIQLGVAYKEDIGKVMKVLREIAENNPYCLDEPEPVILFQEFGNSSLDFLFGVWFAKTDLLLLRNSIMREIKERFDAEDIEIPFPHRTLYAGSVTAPFPVRLVADEPGSGGQGSGGAGDSPADEPAPKN